MLFLNNITLQRGKKVLFQSANLAFYANQKIGLIGKNGCGKSSLFSLILNDLQTDQGELTIQSGMKIAHVIQEIPNTPKKAIDYVIDGDSELRQIEKQLEKEQNGLLIAKLYTQLEDIDGYTVHARAATLLNGLGFSNQQMNQPVTSLSGGWRMRLNLARALISRSNILLLDEPTNHLDLPAIVWLERWLNHYTGLLILISHDRELLDHTTTHIAHIEHQTIKLYTGNYETFERERAEKLSLQQKLHEKQQKQRAHLQKYIDRFRYKATKAKQAQSRIKALARMELIEAANIDIPFDFAFREPLSNPPVLLKLEHIHFSYGLNEVLQNIELQIETGMRVGLLGLNGAGKSTFIKLLANKLQPTKGSIEKHKALKVGYFSQFQLDQLDPEKTPLAHLQAIDPKITEQDHRKFLGRFGFSGDMALGDVTIFSGGEKARLVLALIIWQKPNLLLLDEPTNHLDMDMRHALTRALQDFQGAMIIVSHDRYLLNATTDQLYLVEQKQVTPYKGDLNDYVKGLFSSSTEHNQNADKTVTSGNKTTEPKKANPQKVRQIESQLERSEKRKQEIETALSDTSIYEEENQAKLQTFLTEQSTLDQEIKALEKEWMALN